MADNDDNESYSEIDDRNDDKSGDESEMDVDELREPDTSAYAVWKSNAQYLYDLLLHNHTSWPSSNCAWGPILNTEYLTPVSPLSQRIFFATHTDGNYNPNTKKWSDTPECVILGSVEMTRRRGTQTWFIAKYNESQRNRNFVTLKHIVHPGGVGRLKVVPDTEWVVSHSTDSRLYFWNTKTQKNHSARDGTDASPADLCFITCNGDKLTEYPLAVYSRQKATFVRKTEIPLMSGSKISAPEFYETPKESSKRGIKRGGNLKHGKAKRTKKEETKEETNETPVEETPDEEEKKEDIKEDSDKPKEDDNETPKEEEDIENDSSKEEDSPTEKDDKNETPDEKEVIRHKHDGIEYRFLCVSKTNLHLWNMKDLSPNNSSPSILYELADFMKTDSKEIMIEDICFLDGFNMNGTFVGIAGSDGFVGVYDLEKKEMVWSNTTEHKGDVLCIINISTAQAYQRVPYENMNKYVLTCGEDKRILVWNIEDCLKNPKQGPFLSLETSSSIMCIDYCPQIPRYIAVGTESGEIDLFDLLAKGADEYLVLRHLGHKFPVNDLQFNPYELLTVLSCSDDNDIGGGSIQIWRPHELLMMNVEINENEKNEALEEIVGFMKKYSVCYNSSKTNRENPE